MEEVHREVLVRCRKQLVDDMMMEVLWDHLIQDKVVTPDMKNYMQDRAKQQLESPASILLDHLPKRGPRAFEDFCRCLQDSGHEHLAEELQNILKEVQKQNPEAKSVTRQHSQGAAASPQVTENVSGKSVADSAGPGELPQLLDVLDMPLYRLNSSDELIMHIFRSSAHPASELYQMTRNPRGRVLLIINSNYSPARQRGYNYNDRVASDVDQLMLERVFSQLQFIVKVHTDLTAKELEDAVKAASQLDHSSYDCFACIFSAHGLEEGIVGTDGDLVKVENLLPLFDGQNCKSLAGKPKIFFIQAPRGDKMNTAVELDSSTPAKVSPQDVVAELMMNNLAYACSIPGIVELGIASSSVPSSYQTHASEASSMHPSMADFFVAYATPPGYQAFRNTEGGSWFLRALVIVFKEFSSSHSLNRMMTKVNRFLSKGQSSKGYKQTCIFWSTLTKELYFFPGLQE